MRRKSRAIKSAIRAVLSRLDLGWIVGSLKYWTEKEIQDTLLKNDTFLSNQWSLPERVFIWCARHFFLSNVLIFLLAVICSTLIAKYYMPLQELFPETEKDLHSLLHFQPTIFGAQATLLGLVFPLVIAFIGILLQGKSSNESMWINLSPSLWVYVCGL